MTKLEKLMSIDKDVLRNFLRTGEKSAISPVMQDYIRKMNTTASIIHLRGTSLKRVTEALMDNYPELSYSQARSIFYDALQFFWIDDNLSAETWDNYYADRMEDLFRLAVKADRLDIAFKASVKAHEYRTQNRNVVSPEDWKPPVFIVSNELTPEELGYKKRSVYEIARRKEKGEYSRLIDSLPVSEKEKQRLRMEADVTDVECEEVEDGQ